MYLLNSQLVLQGLSCVSFATTGCVPSCKTYPGSADWPSPAAWNKLNDHLEGRLLQPAPPGAVCHLGQPTYDAGKCEAVRAEWVTYDFHLEDPVSVMWNNWTNDTCLPDVAYPCSPAGYPAYVVNATTPEHVKLGVDFARQNHLRLNVKSTGHDFHGRSNAPGSLSIWVHYINSIEYHEDAFKLDGSNNTIPGNAMTFGGGTDAYTAYLKAGEHDQIVVGGTARSVGLVGHSSAGGHSILSSHYGLAADQILQMQVVTPGGDILIVNEDQYSDLFWALRGGGGSTFGVVTALTLKTFPSIKMAKIPFSMTIPLESCFWDVVACAINQFPTLGDAGLSGYFLASSNPGFFNSTKIPGILGGTAIVGHDITQVEDAFRALNRTIQQQWQNSGVEFHTEPPTFYDSFLDWYAENYDKGGAGGSVFLTSRLVGKKDLADVDVLADALKAAAGDQGHIQAYIVAGKGTAESKPRGGSNAVHPAWRTAYLHMLTARGFPPLNKTAKAEAVETIRKIWQPLRDMTPGGGSYVNEGFPYELDYQRTFWGENYERLLKIKREVDPLDVLWCHPCVGNERWKEREDGRLCLK